MSDPLDPFEKYSRFVADWDRFVAPWNLQTLEYVKLAVEYSKLALQSAFILNGGAILALAPLVQNHIDSVQQAAVAAVWFIVGLIGAAAATFFAYYNFAVNGELCVIYRDTSDFDLKKNYGFELTDGEIQNHSNLQSNRERRQKIVVVTMWLAILVGVVSYGAFCCGALLLT